MYKRLICFVFSLIFILFIAVPFNSEAYLTPSSFTSYRSSSPYDYSASYDGIYLFQTTYKSFYGPDTISSPAMLNDSYFVSGTWNGQSVDELDSKYLYDIDVSGFSQAFSYTDEGGFFVYSMITCLPVKAGDNFRISFKANSVNVREFSYHSLYSYIPGGSGCRMIHFEYGEHPDSPLSYTVRSANQHLVLVLNPDTFNSSSGFFKPSQSCNCTSFSSLTSVGYNADCTDFFTTPYNYPSGSDVSVTLKESVDNYSFSVYEIFTDGTLTPGFNTEGEPTTTPDDSGSGGSSSEQTEISNNILANIKNIISYIASLPQNIADKLGGFFTELKNSFSSAITGLYNNLISGLEYLFKPSDNLFIELQEVLEDKFKFVYQVLEFGKSVISADFLDVPPNNKITLYGKEIVFMDWTLYDNYKGFIDTIIIIVSYYFYIQKLIKRIPGIIGGFTNDN